jgi:HK97 family phage portal protein
MKLLEKTLSLIGFEKRSNNGDNYWDNFNALRTGAVTPQAAETLSTVSACVSAISETIGSLPLHLYKRTPEGRERNTEHSLARVLHDAPNERQSALEFREMMTAAMLLRGNAFARILRGADGQVKQLIPLHPDRVRVLELDNGRLGYEVGTNEKTEKLIQEDVFHLRHRSDDGIVGISPIARSKEVIELALAERNHGNETFQNGAKLLGVLKAPGRLNPEQRKALAQSWKQYKAGATPVLDEGMDYQTVSMSLEDSEYIEARKFSVIEVCRLFRVPPVIVQSMESANYSNSVELARQFVTLCLRRHLLAWEQAISRQLLTEAGRRIYFAEHGLEGLLRGDSATRSAFYHDAISDGWMTVDEVRQLENLPKLPSNKFKSGQPPKGAA